MGRGKPARRGTEEWMIRRLPLPAPTRDPDKEGKGKEVILLLLSQLSLHSFSFSSSCSSSSSSSQYYYYYYRFTISYPKTLGLDTSDFGKEDYQFIFQRFLDKTIQGTVWLSGSVRPVESCFITIVYFLMTKVFIRYHLGKFIIVTFNCIIISRSFFTTDFQIFYTMKLLKFLQLNFSIFVFAFNVQFFIVFSTLFHYH